MHIFRIGKYSFHRPLSPIERRRIRLTSTIADDIPKDVKKSILPLVSKLAKFGNKNWFNFAVERSKGLKEGLIITSHPVDYEAGRLVKKKPFMSTLIDLNKVNSSKYLSEVAADMQNVLGNISK